jgi:hypothetical protein
MGLLVFAGAFLISTYVRTLTQKSEPALKAVADAAAVRTTVTTHLPTHDTDLL